MPDPALLPAGARPAGLRSHLHEPDHLYAWVFFQHQVWVDGYGNEHEIELMARAYVANVIGFCLCRAERIRALVASEALGQVAELVRQHRVEESLESLAAVSFDMPATAWLNATPLMRALHRRLENCQRHDGGRIGWPFVSLWPDNELEES